MTRRDFELDAVVIGGCGHVGLPLAIALASRGARVGIYDVSQTAVDTVNAGQLPFAEPGRGGAAAGGPGAGPADGVAPTRPSSARAEHVIVVIGTPVDEHLNPEPDAVPNALGGCARPTCGTGRSSSCAAPSTPASRRWWRRLIAALGVDIDVAFCPERIAEGQAMTELFELPQIVSARTARGVERASALFRRLTSQLVVHVARRRPSWPSCSPTSGGTSSSPPPTSST